MALVYPLMAFLFLGAMSLYMVLPREKNSLATVGSLLGIFSLVGLLLYFERSIPAPGGSSGLPIFFYVFAAIMVIGSVAVIANPKPVYAALYFVLVTLAGAGLFVLLLAEFMAVVLIIIYAGAILVTYVFVIMLASQTGKQQSPLYDRVASEPLVAVTVSFVLLATILNAMYPTSGLAFQEDAHRGTDRTMVAAITVETSDDALPTTTNPADVALSSAPVPTGTQILGASLYGHYPISLEIGGILLTVALVGAVVIARKHIGSAAIGALAEEPLPSE